MPQRGPSAAPGLYGDAGEGARGDEDTDAQLLARVAAADVAALSVLYERYGRRAFALAYRVTGSPEAAEEVVQDAFLALWRRAEQFTPGRGAVWTWLLTIVRNRALDHLRARQARPQTVTAVEHVGEWLSAPHDTCAAALSLLDASTVRAAVAMLPPMQRQAVELAYFGGLTYLEVAVTTGAPLGTVKSRMRLALTSLRETLTPAAMMG